MTWSRAQWGTAATFWFGLLDDVRIYNRVVQPAAQ
jgi:hypothetical protein